MKLRSGNRIVNRSRCFWTLHDNGQLIKVKTEVDQVPRSRKGKLYIYIFSPSVNLIFNTHTKVAASLSWGQLSNSHDTTSYRQKTGKVSSSLNISLK